MEHLEYTFWVFDLKADKHFKRGGVYTSLDACKKAFANYRAEWEDYYTDWDFDDTIIKTRKVIMTDWEQVK